MNTPDRVPSWVNRWNGGIVVVVLLVLFVLYAISPVLPLIIQPDRGVPESPEEQIIVPPAESRDLNGFRINCIPSREPVSTESVAYQCSWVFKVVASNRSEVTQEAIKQMNGNRDFVIEIIWKKHPDSDNYIQKIDRDRLNATQFFNQSETRIESIGLSIYNYQGKYTIRAPPEPGDPYRLTVSADIRESTSNATTELKVWDRTELSIRQYNVRTGATQFLTGVAAVFGGIQLIISLSKQKNERS